MPIAQQFGFDSAHDLKKQYEVDSKSDIYVDSNGNLFIARKGQEQNLEARDYLYDNQRNIANTRIGLEGKALTCEEEEDSEDEAANEDATQENEAFELGQERAAAEVAEAQAEAEALAFAEELEAEADE